MNIISTKDSAKKKVLLIAYHFPPDSAVGGLRIAKFARYLPYFDWEPTVLTVEDRFRHQLDMERLKDLGGTKIVKTPQLPTLTKSLLSIKRMVPMFLKKRKMAETEHEDLYGENPGYSRAETFLQKLKRYYLSLSSFPDGERCWVIPAARQAIKEIKQVRFDCIMTSSPPHSSHLIGLIVKKCSNVKWIADFRDPWIDVLPNRSSLVRSALSDKNENWLEKLVIRNADKIITTTDEHRKVIASRFPHEPPKKFVYIPNGIDSEKFNNSLPERYDKFTISYVGTIYLKRTPEPIFKAIQELVHSNKIRPDEIRFKLIGDCGLIDGKPTASIARAHGLEKIVEVSGPVPYMDAITVMQRSHLLVLLATAIQNINIPAKIYDYFGSGTKIIAITEHGATSRLIESTKSGECFKPSDIDGIAEYIFQLMTNKNRDSFRNNPSFYAQFDTKLLAGKLAEQFSSLRKFSV